MIITALLSAMTIDSSPVDCASQPAAVNNAGKVTAVRDVPQDTLKWRRDPFINGGTQKNDAQKTGPAAAKKATSKPSGQTDINIQGIMQADRAFHALIDGRVYKKGDRIGQLTIMEISRYCVVVQNELKEQITHDIHKGKITRGEK